MQSLHVQSYARSRIYLSKWRVFREINILAGQNEATSVQERSPRWLVKRYLEANLIDFENNNKDHPTYTPRHVHRSEVFNLLARHCYWLTEKLSKQRPAVVDTAAWKKFVAYVNPRLEGLRVPNQANHINQLDCNDIDEFFSEEVELMPDEEQPADVDALLETDHEDDYELGFQETVRCTPTLYHI